MGDTGNGKPYAQIDYQPIIIQYLESSYKLRLYFYMINPGTTWMKGCTSCKSNHAIDAFYSCSSCY